MINTMPVRTINTITLVSLFREVACPNYLNTSWNIRRNMQYYIELMGDKIIFKSND